MNQLLGYNIASEPTIFPHEKHRFPLVDGATYSFFGENMGFDDFKNPVAVLAPYFYIFTVLFTICLEIYTVSKLKSNCLKFTSCVFSAIGLCLLAYRFREDYGQLQVCSIPWKCYEAENGTIDYSVNYYIVPGECYRITELGYLYADENREGDEWGCKNSHYGCCSIDVRCINAIENEWDYSLMERPNTGYMNIPMKKDDNFGSNCPNVNDLIETKINLELYEIYQRYFGMCILAFLAYLSTYLPCNDNKYEKTNNDILP